MPIIDTSNISALDLYNNDPKYKVQMDAIAKAAKDKGKAEAANDEAVKSAQNVNDTIQQDTPDAAAATNVMSSTPMNNMKTINTSPSNMMNRIRSVNDNAKDQTTEPSFNIGNTWTDSQEYKNKNMKKFSNGKASVAEIVQGYRDGYFTEDMIKNNSKYSESDKNEFINKIKEDEQYKNNKANENYKKSTEKDTVKNTTSKDTAPAKDDLQTKLKNHTLTPDEYQKNNILPKDLIDAGYTKEEAMKLYGKDANLSNLNAAYENNAQPKNNVNGGASTDNNYSKETKQALQDAKSTIDKDSQKKDTSENIKDYTDYSNEWNQNDIRPTNNLIDAYRNGDIDGKTFAYYLTDWLGTGLRNASHFTPGAYGGNKQAETSKWDALQSKLADKQADLSYAQKSADIANKQSIAGNSTGAVQNAANTVNVSGVDITKDFYERMSDPKLDAKGRMEAVKEYANSHGLNANELAKGLLTDMALNGTGSAQIVGALGSLLSDDEKKELLSTLQTNIDKTANAAGNVTNLVGGAASVVGGSANGLVEFCKWLNGDE